MTEAYAARFGGIDRLFGEGSVARLKSSHVAILGIGGVGSWTAEALARSGVGAITLVDQDDVCVSNVNRQLHALEGQIGQPKLEVMAQRLGLINPECRIESIPRFVTPASVEAILDGEFDYVVDSVDQASNKCVIIDYCRRQGLPLVTVGSAGGKKDATCVAADDITRATNDPLLKRVRKILRRDFDFPRDFKELWQVGSVFSAENVELPHREKRRGNKGVRLSCEFGYGSAGFVTGTFGLVAAGYVVRKLVNPVTGQTAEGDCPPPVEQES